MTSLFATLAAAQTPAVRLLSPPVNLYADSSYSMGWKFWLGEPTSIAALGVLAAGGHGDPGPRQVALYRYDGSLAISPVSVAPGDPVLEGFRYHYLAAPVWLESNLYVIAEVTLNDFYTWGYANTCQASFAGPVQYQNDLYTAHVTQMVFPTRSDGWNGTNGYGYFGPNFLISNPGQGPCEFRFVGSDDRGFLGTYSGSATRRSNGVFLSDYANAAAPMHASGGTGTSDGGLSDPDENREAAHASANVAVAVAGPQPGAYVVTIVGSGQGFFDAVHYTGSWSAGISLNQQSWHLFLDPAQAPPGGWRWARVAPTNPNMFVSISPAGCAVLSPDRIMPGEYVITASATTAVSHTHSSEQWSDTWTLYIGGFPSCDADYNVDGNLDQDDVAYLVNALAGGPNPSGRDLDFNLDGNPDQDDLRALVNVIAGGSCP